MMRASVQELAQACQGQWMAGTLTDAPAALAAREVHGADLDTRRLRRGQLFVAISGTRIDGHDLLSEAARAGASAALVARAMPVALPQIVVPDVTQALRAIARFALAQLPQLTRLALTGSNGKTTVKNLLHAILSRVGACTATEGNRNNELGVPLTAISMDANDRFGVFEMGAGTPGDIEQYCQVAVPHIAMVNNIAPAHLERLGSLQGVAETKAGVYRAMAGKGCAVIPADDDFADYFRAQAVGSQQLSFGVTAEADVRVLACGADELALDTPLGAIRTRFALPGEHNRRNAAAAVAMAIAAGASSSAISEGLSAVSTSAGRLHSLPCRLGGTLIDDSYNANPGSFAAGLRALVAGVDASTAWVAMGDMAELGPEAPQLHAQLGKLCRELGVARLYCCGPLSAHAAHAAGSMAQHFVQRDELIKAVCSDWQSGVTLLVKGSRSAGMEHVVQALQGAAP